MFTHLKEELFNVTKEQMSRTLEKLITSLEYLQVSLENGNDVDKWLKVCCDETRKLSTQFRMLRWFLVKEK